MGRSITVSYAWRDSLEAVALRQAIPDGAVQSLDPRKLAGLLECARPGMGGEARGVWVDVDNAGQIAKKGLAGAVDAAIASSDAVVVFVSDEYASSPRCLLETKAALASPSAPPIIVVILGARRHSSHTATSSSVSRGALGAGAGRGGAVRGMGAGRGGAVGGLRRDAGVNVNAGVEGWENSEIGELTRSCPRVDLRGVNPDHVPPGGTLIDPLQPYERIARTIRHAVEKAVGVARRRRDQAARVTRPRVREGADERLARLQTLDRVARRGIWRTVVLKRTVEPNLRETASRGDLRVRVGEECTLLRFEQTARVIKSYKVPESRQATAIPLSEGDRVIVHSRVPFEGWGGWWVKAEGKDGRRGAVPADHLAEDLTQAKNLTQKRAVLRAADGTEGTCPVDAFSYKDAGEEEGDAEEGYIDAGGEEDEDGEERVQGIASAAALEEDEHQQQNRTVINRCRRAALELLASLEAQGAIPPKEAHMQRETIGNTSDQYLDLARAVPKLSFIHPADRKQAIEAAAGAALEWFEAHITALSTRLSTFLDKEEQAHDYLPIGGVALRDRPLARLLVTLAPAVIPGERVPWRERLRFPLEATLVDDALEYERVPWAELSAGVIKALGEDAFVLEWPRSGELISDEGSWQSTFDFLVDDWHAKRVWCGELALTVHSLGDPLPAYIEVALQKQEQASEANARLKADQAPQKKPRIKASAAPIGDQASTPKRNKAGVPASAPAPPPSEKREAESPHRGTRAVADAPGGKQEGARDASNGFRKKSHPEERDRGGRLGDAGEGEEGEEDEETAEPKISAVERRAVSAQREETRQRERIERVDQEHKAKNVAQQARRAAEEALRKKATLLRHRKERVRDAHMRGARALADDARSTATLRVLDRPRAPPTPSVGTGEEGSGEGRAPGGGRVVAVRELEEKIRQDRHVLQLAREAKAMDAHHSAVRRRARGGPMLPDEEEEDDAGRSVVLITRVVSAPDVVPEEDAAEKERLGQEAETVAEAKRRFRRWLRWEHVALLAKLSLSLTEIARRPGQPLATLLEGRPLSDRADLRNAAEAAVEHATHAALLRRAAIKLSAARACLALDRAEPAELGDTPPPPDVEIAGRDLLRRLQSRY
ncbi:hypothetical protein T484DRAFT_1896582, partial [Baffinella frigidus]